MIGREAGWPRVLLLGPVPEHEGGTSTGGVATHVAELAQALARAGVGVAVYADNSVPFEQPLTRSWGPLFGRMPLSRTLVGIRPLLSIRSIRLSLRTAAQQGPLEALGKRYAVTLSNVLGLDRAIRLFDPDIIHCHQPDFRAAYLRVTGDSRPCVLTMHSLSALADRTPPHLRDLALRSVHAADKVVCVSEDVRQGLEAVAPSVQSLIIVNGVDLERFRSAARDLDVPLSNVGPLLLFVGRVAVEKGADDLMRAFATVLSIHPRARLVLAGPLDGYDPAEGALAMGLPRESWEHTGPVDPAEVARLLSATDVLVMPSRLREGQPRVIIEAMAAGTPVVATSVGSIPKLLAGGEAGVLVPPGDPDALAQSLLRLLGDRAASRRIAQAAESLASSYDVNGVASELLAVYKQAIDEAASR